MDLRRKKKDRVYNGNRQSEDQWGMDRMEQNRGRNDKQRIGKGIRKWRTQIVKGTMITLENERNLI